MMKNSILVFLIITLILSCSSPTRSQDGANNERGENDPEIIKDRGHASDRDHLYLLRRDLEEFAEKRVPLGGIHYRLRPSKSPLWKYISVDGRYIVDREKEEVIKKAKIGGGRAWDWHPNKPWIFSASQKYYLYDPFNEKEILQSELSAKPGNVHYTENARMFPDKPFGIVTYQRREKWRWYIDFIDLSDPDNPVIKKTIGPDGENLIGRKITFSSNGEYFFISGEPEKEGGKYYFNVYDSDTLDPVFQLQTKETAYGVAKFKKSASGKEYLYIVGKKDAIEIYKLPFDEKNSPIYRREGTYWTIRNIDVLPDRNVWATHNGTTAAIYFFERKKDKDLQIKRAVTISPGNRMADVQFGPDGEKLYIVPASGDLWIFSVDRLINIYKEFTNVENYYKHLHNKERNKPEKSDQGHDHEHGNGHDHKHK